MKPLFEKKRNIKVDFYNLKETFTIEERNIIYRKTKEDFVKSLNDRYRLKGLCSYFHFNLYEIHNLSLNFSYIIKMLPEFQKYKNTNSDTDYWWDKDDTQSRLDCLDDIIEKSKP